MLHWSIFSPAKLAFFFLVSVFPVLFGGFLFFSSGCSVLMLEWEVFSFGGVMWVFPVIFDKLSLVFSIVVVLISLSVMLFSVSYMNGDPSLEYFVYMVVLFVFSMNVLVFVPHLFFLLLGWDGLGLTSYLLVIYYLNDKSLGAGMLTAMTNRIGDALLIVASGFSFVLGHWMLSFCSFGLFSLVLFLVIVASMTKSAQIPFSAWLPAAMAAPTPVSSLVHSSTLVTAGVYLMIRFYPSLCLFQYFGSFVFYFGTLTCLMASSSAFYENDLKKIIALSTLSQLGIMMVGIGVAHPMLAFFHLVTHAMFKALLFVCAGMIIHGGQDNQDIRLMGDMWLLMPVTSVALNVANLALCSFPFLAGSYSKDTLVESYMLQTDFSLSDTTMVLMVLSVFMTTAYSIRLSVMTLWSPFKGGSVFVGGDESFYVHIPCLILLFGAVCGGALFSWVLLPLASVMLWPLYLKITALFSFVFFGVVAYVLVSLGVSLAFFRFMGSMWFLSLLSSSSFSGRSLKLGVLLYVSDLTWLEFFVGKGVFSVVSFVSSFVVRGQNLEFSQLMSLFSSVVFVLYLLF